MRGGRCNNWKYGGTGHFTGPIADSEWAGVTPSGDIHYYFDHDTQYTGYAADGHAGPGYEGEIGQPGTGNGGNCGDSYLKSILCCSTCG